MNICCGIFWAPRALCHPTTIAITSHHTSNTDSGVKSAVAHPVLLFGANFVINLGYATDTYIVSIVPIRVVPPPNVFSKRVSTKMSNADVDPNFVL